ncbi:ABC transporter ATP-binding protein [Sphingomicrobium marinum]|uniref:ABC transporter ATP-binding protein n=1 Tax=Sphingomicrobium marinum TaxID=1227950 RepID=UPI00223E9BA0|nr:ABC transporter ATP-binding protein [Sphingomicrobium marinum]
MNGAAIEANGLVRCFGERAVVDGVDLRLERGKVTAILGPSGAGKSTLLRMLAGFEPVDAGTIRRGDVILSGDDRMVPPEKRDIGIVFQDFALFPHLTALGNVMFGLSGAGKRDTAVARLEALDLVARANAYPHELSGGEQQRVALARAMAREPAAILLDEAFSSLDTRLRQSLRETTLEALHAVDAAVLLVTHDAEEAMFMADELALMIDGRIVQRGAPREVYAAPVSDDAARLLGDVNMFEGTVRGGMLATPFGDVSAAGLAEGAIAHALVRPEAMTVLPEKGGAYLVRSADFLGTAVKLVVEAEDGRRCRARVGLAAAPAEGTRVTVAIDPALATVVPVG